MGAPAVSDPSTILLFSETSESFGSNLDLFVVLFLELFDWLLNLPLREKCPNAELFLVHIFLYSD